MQPSFNLRSRKVSAGIESPSDRCRVQTKRVLEGCCRLQAGKGTKNPAWLELDHECHHAWQASINTRTESRESGPFWDPWPLSRGASRRAARRQMRWMGCIEADYGVVSGGTGTI